MSLVSSTAPVATPVSEQNATNSTAGNDGHGLLAVIISLPATLFLLALLMITVLLVVLVCSRQVQREGSEEGGGQGRGNGKSPDPSNGGIVNALQSILRLGQRGNTGTAAGTRDRSRSQPSSFGSLSSLAKLEHQPHRMQSNPTYSASNLSICGTTLEEDPHPGIDEVEAYDIHSYCGQMDTSMVNELLQSYTSVYDQPLVTLTDSGGPPLEVSEKNVQEVRLLGVGQFGRVVLAETVGMGLEGTRLTHIDKGVSIRVAVKKLKLNAELEVREAFQREIKIMSGLSHKNIVRLLGVCTSETPFIIMEYMENGDLNQFLCRHHLAPTSTTSNKLDVSTLLFMSLQIASGMEYLASLRFVHRDLASRNCLVGQRYTVKIADFGMSRSLYASQYFRLKGRAVLPIRWMASECFYGQFSEKTDVWAFGVTMWEIFELAKRQPFQGLSNAEVVDNAMKGSERLMLPRPLCCPAEVYEVMLSCWEHRPDERAGFHEVHSSLAQLYTQQFSST